MCDCKEGEFKCIIAGGCISINEKCDGIDQCADHSDEWGCIKENSAANIVEVSFRKCSPVSTYKNNVLTRYN